MSDRIEKADIDFLCEVTMSLAFVAQRINRQLSKGGKPRAGTTALEGFRKIDFVRLQRLKEELPLLPIEGLIECYNEVLESEKNGWRTYVLEWAWKPDLYDKQDPMRSMSVVQWGVVRGKTDHGASWGDGCALPLSWRLAQQGQVRTLLDIAKTLNESYHFKNPQDFHQVYFECIHKSLQRRTFSETAIKVLVEVMNRDQEELFRGGKMNFGKYAEAVERDLGNDEMSPIGYVFVQRAKVMFLRVAALLNDMMHYDSPDAFLADVGKVCDAGALDPFARYGVVCDLAGEICANWKKLSDKNEVLNSAKIERHFHSAHYDKVASKGLEAVLKSDYSADSSSDSGTVFYPKKDLSAPIYVEDRFFRDHCTDERMYVKSCGNCGDVFAPELFEFDAIMPIVEREIAAGNYIRVRKYILPAFDDSLPIFREGQGRVHFEIMHDQIKFMRHYRETGDLPDVDIR